VGETEPEIDAAIQTVTTALAHPLMRRAAAVEVGRLRRECPVLLRTEDGTILEGVVDLAFLESGGKSLGWTVVDFKTDREFELHRGVYTAQVALYADAIGTATKLPVAGVILVV
jgi:ATP-dependent helicase/nuclease subunit A